MSNIFTVINKYVDLERRSKNYFGLCPFHNEKTPSFAVFPDKNIYHCFGCNAGGDSNDFMNKLYEVRPFENN